MTATLFIVEYASFGGRRLGGEDDISGSLPQIPGKIIGYKELDLTSPGDTYTLSSTTGNLTTFVGYQVFGGDAWVNFDTGGVSTLTADNRERITPGQRMFQGAVLPTSNTQIYTQINAIDVS